VVLDIGVNVSAAGKLARKLDINSNLE